MAYLLVLFACSGEVERTDVPSMADYFPTDGTRRAEFVNDDTTNVPWTLVVETVDGVASGGNQVTFEWSREDTGEVLGAVTWSSSESDGIFIHALTDAAGLVEMYNPAIQVAEAKMNVGDVVTTETGGHTYMSTFVGWQECPVAWGNTWTCLHLALDDGDDDPMAGPLFAGDYWLVPTYGPAWMKTTGYAEKWDLLRHEWSGDGG